MFDIFLIFAQNIDCEYTLESPRRGGSNEYQQSMFWSKTKIGIPRHTPVFLYKMGFRGDILHGYVFLMGWETISKIIHKAKFSVKRKRSHLSKADKVVIQKTLTLRSLLHIPMEI